LKSPTTVKALEPHPVPQTELEPAASKSTLAERVAAAAAIHS
jgi:hypothetical protein